MTLSVPVIDLSQPDRTKLSRLIHEACAEWGFFQVSGHGVPQVLSADMLAAAESFFADPNQTKRQIIRTAENPWGFFDAELTKNTPDWKEIVDIGPERDGQKPQWPEQPADFRAVMEAYTRAVDRVARNLLQILLENLGDTRGQELGGFARDTSFLRLNYYPCCSNPAPADLAVDVAADESVGHLGISHHTDAGALTVLQQHGPAGLQVLHQGEWKLVPVLPDALVINIGDVAQVWSNDRYPAPLHRVLANSTHKRFSAAFFFNPDFDYSYAPLAGCVTKGSPGRYRPINWREFRGGRAAGDYADSGEEIQISDYLL